MNKNDLIKEAIKEYHLSYFKDNWSYKWNDKWETTEDQDEIEQRLLYLWVIYMDQKFDRKLILEVIQYFKEGIL